MSKTRSKTAPPASPSPDSPATQVARLKEQLAAAGKINRSLQRSLVEASRQAEGKARLERRVEAQHRQMENLERSRAAAQRQCHHWQQAMTALLRTQGALAAVMDHHIALRDAALCEVAGEKALAQLDDGDVPF